MPPLRRRRATIAERLLAAAVLATLCLCAAGTFPGRAAAETMELRQRAIERFRARPDPADRIAFMGGLVLSGPRDFGGLSGLLTRGERLLAVSDTGRWLLARMILRDGRLAGLDEARWVPMRGVDGRVIAEKRDGDFEALALVHDGVLALHEQFRDVFLYPSDGLAVDVDAAARRLPLEFPSRRVGFEAMAGVPSGPLLVFDERPAGGRVAGYRRPGGRFTVAARGEWSVTGADALPGGDLLLVERRYRGGIDIAVRVRRIGRDSALSGAGPIDGPVLLEAGFSAEIDNMEGIAAEVAGDRIVFTLLSDDNLSFWQRTLLLRFALTDPVPVRKPPVSLADGSGRS